MKLFTVNTLDNQYAKSCPCKSPGTLSLPASLLYPSSSSPEPSLCLLYHRYCSEVSQKHLKVPMIPFSSLLLLLSIVCKSNPYRVAGHLHFLPYSIFGMNMPKLICTFCCVLQISVYRFMVYRFLLVNVCIQLWESKTETPKPWSTDMLALVDPGE